MMRGRPKGLSNEGQIRAAVSLKYGISPSDNLQSGKHTPESHRCLTHDEISKLFDIVRNNNKYRTILSLTYDLAARA